MFKYYVEAYDYYGKPLLGNLDGQGVIHAREFQRTDYFKALQRGRWKADPVYTKGRVISLKVHHWKIVRAEDGQLVATVMNPCFSLKENEAEMPIAEVGQSVQVRDKSYVVVDGTYYHESTPQRVIETLEASRKNRTRIKLWYGDTATGQAWGDVEVGTVGRSMGPVKIPILLHNRRSTGGGAILDHCIIRIEYSRKGSPPLYSHPNFHETEN